MNDGSLFVNASFNKNSFDFIWVEWFEWFLKMFCALFEQLISPIITECVPKESVLYEGLNDLSAEDETVS